MPILVQILRRGASGQMGEIQHLIIFYIHIPFFIRGTTLRPILTRDDSKDAKSRKDVPFLGLQKLKVTFNPFLGPPNVDFWRKNGQKILD